MYYKTVVLVDFQHGKMKWNLIKPIMIVAFLGSILIGGCTKKNSVTIIETTEPIPIDVRMIVEGTEIETDVVASYCQNDSIEFIMIANKEDNLSLPLATQNFEENDFVFFTSISTVGGTSWAYGTMALGEEQTGVEDFLWILTSDALITIEYVTDQIVAGHSEGLLLGFDPITFEWFDFSYSIEFTAEIIAVNDFCG